LSNEYELSINFISDNKITLRNIKNKYITFDTTKKNNINLSIDISTENSILELIPISTSKVAFKINGYYLTFSKEGIGFFTTKLKSSNAFFLSQFEMYNKNNELFYHKLKIPQNVHILKELETMQLNGLNIYPKSTIIELPAPLNANDSWLGNLLDDEMKKIDVIKPKPNIKSLDLNKYDFKYDEINNSMQASASGNYLFASMSKNELQYDKNIIMSASQLQKIKYIDNYPTNYYTPGKLLIVGIVYGWSYDLKFTENENNTNLEFGIKTFKSMSGAELKNAVNEKNINYELSVRGMKLKSDDANGYINFFDDIFSKQWKPSDKPVPLYLKCEVYEDFIAPDLDFEAPEIKEGEYVITGFNILCNETKDNSPWDMLPSDESKMDPYIIITQPNQLNKQLDYKSNTNKYVVNNLEIPIRLSKSNSIMISLYDRDVFGSDDRIGSIDLSQIIGKKYKKKIRLTDKNGYILSAYVSIKKK
ncbi:MAG: C2 domain-containing protein, partial [Candidatus Kapabacteria bacterium]|nr:C2 domain-containing protein [Candidatus Kapabacteria bacterium]